MQIPAVGPGTFSPCPCTEISLHFPGGANRLDTVPIGGVVLWQKLPKSTALSHRHLRHNNVRQADDNTEAWPAAMQLLHGLMRSPRCLVVVDLDVGAMPIRKRFSRGSPSGSTLDKVDLCTMYYSDDTGWCTSPTNTRRRHVCGKKQRQAPQLHQTVHRPHRQGSVSN